MIRILDLVVEPSKVYVNQAFKIKVKVQDDYTSKKMIISENNHQIISETGDYLRTEWGE